MFCHITLSQRDVHEIRDEAVYQPAKDNDDEMNVKDEDMEVTCQLGDNDILRKVRISRWLGYNFQIQYENIRRYQNNQSN